VKRLRERARVVAQVRQFFAARDFLEVQTPVLVPSPGLDLHLDAFEATGGDRGAPRWLATSPEYQMKRLLADGYERIVQIGPCFRRGEVGSRHNPEFTMLEWYRAHAGMDDVIRDTEQLVAAVTGGLVRLEERRIDVRPPFERIGVCEAFERFAGWTRATTLEAAARDEDRYFRAMVDLVEPALEKLDQAVFVVDYPATQASLARRKPGDPELAERFELYVAGVELCNGFGELVDPVEQRARLEQDQAARRAQGLPVYPIDERFLEALARVPPSGGNALGLDRLVALTCGTTSIADVVAFVADEL
jgi:lysyl-tRNA synthetase class 2